jgi:PAS domain S-box-containing protein
MSVKFKLVLGLGTALAILIAVGGTSYIHLESEDETARAVVHSHQVIETVDRVLIELDDAETGQRGYLLTDDKAYLAPFNVASRELRGHLEQLSRLAANDPAERSEAEAVALLSARKMRELRETISLEQAGRNAEGLEIVRDGFGKRAMDRIRALLGRMRSREKGRLAQRAESAAGAAREERFVLVGGFGVAFVLLFLAGAVIWRERERGLAIEADLRRSETRYRLFFEGNPLPAWIYDIKTYAILQVNPSAIRKYGYTREEFLGMTAKDIRPEEDVAKFVAEMEMAPDKEDRGEWRHQKRDGTIITVAVTSHRMNYGGRDARLVVAADVSELKRAEMKFRGLLESAPDAVVIVDKEGRIVLVNAQTEALFGWPREELQGKQVEELVPDVHRTRHSAQREEYQRHPHVRPMSAGLELFGRRKDGGVFPADIELAPLETNEGLLISSVIRDISERKRAEALIQKRSAELEAANKELEAFSYSVSHDLRAPLRAIDGFGQALLEDNAGQLDAEGKRRLERIRRASQRMGQLIDDLLKLARLTRAELRRQAVDLTAVAREIADDLRKSDGGRRVKFQIEDGLRAEADPQLMHILLENLIGNAWKFTARRPAGIIEFRRVGGNGSAAFFVRDNGAGFDPNYANQLFAPFQRLHNETEFPGTGIGLATVQRIVMRHGGKVWAEGAVERGATFYFEVPQ